MIIKVTNQEFAYLKEIIRKKTEIALDDNKKYLVETRLSSLVFEAGCETFGQFCKKLNYGHDSAVFMEKVVEAITTNETYWFRDDYPFNYVREIFLARMAEEIKAGKRDEIKIWSAASSYGQEAYSIAMTALEFKKTKILGKPVEKCLDIIATDISNKAVQRAKNGVYSNNDMARGMLENLKRFYFCKANDGWVINEKVRSLVKFSVFNLQSPFPVSWGKFDMIMLRNVIIYFSDPFKRVVLERVARKLAPGGILFLGTGESVSGYTELFQVCDYKKAKYYKLKDDC